MADVPQGSEMGTAYITSCRTAACGSYYSVEAIAAALAAYSQGWYAAPEFVQVDPGPGPTAPPPSPPAAPPPAIPPAAEIPEVVVVAPREPPPPPRFDVDIAPPAEAFAPSPGFLPPAPYYPPALPPEVLPEVIIEAPRRTTPPPRTVRVPVGPLIAAGLVIPFLELLGRIDEAATTRAGERLGLPPRRPPRRTAPGETTPDPFRYGDPRPFGVSGPPLPSRERRPSDTNAPRSAVPSPDAGVDPALLPEVVVTGRTPAVLPAPASWWFPSPLPGADPDFSPFPLDPEPAPAAPSTERRPVSVPIEVPFPSVVEVPQATPFPEVAPTPRSPTRPSTPAPPVVSVPGTPMLPSGDFGVLPQPFTPLTPPPATADPCNCAEKRKKKGKKKPRAVCWKGSYTEKATSLSKQRRVRVDCRTGKELDGAPAAERRKTGKRRSTSPNPPPPSWEIPPP